MPPTPILDLSVVDLQQVVRTKEQIYEFLAHRHEFQLLDGLVYVDMDQGVAVGFYDVKPDAWWVRGHFPQRPLLPGVLMIEAGAQMAAYVDSAYLNKKRLLGFTGLTDVRFRGAVAPPSRLFIVAKAVEIRPRRTICDVQGFVDMTMVFEGRIVGMPI